MVKKTKKIVNNKFSNLFNKLDDFLDQDCAIKSLADTLDSINSKEIFDIYRYIFLNRDDNVSSEYLLSEGNWFDFLELIKDGLTNPESNFDSFKVKFQLLTSICAVNHCGLGYINNHLEIFDGLMLSFDLDSEDFSFARRELLSHYIEEQEFYYKKDAGNDVEINSLFLLDFSDLKSIDSIEQKLDNKIVRAYLKYVSEIISAEELASEIIEEIKSHLDKIKQEIVDKMLGIKIPRFDLYPVSLYSEEELEDFFIKRKENFRYFIESGFFDRVLSGYDEQNYFYDFLKSKLTIKNLTDELLLEAVSVEENSVFIEGYSDLSDDDKMGYIFKLFEKYNPKSLQYYDRQILKNVYKGKIFEFIKKTYKYYLNKFIAGEKLEYEEYLGLIISDSKEEKFVLFKDDYFSKPYINLSEDQVSELKSELEPLLELISDKFYVTNNDNSLSDFLDPDCGVQGLGYCFRLNFYNLFYKLFDIIEWYPRKINFVQNVDDEKGLLVLLDKYSFLRVVEDNPEFDCKLILKFGKNTGWASNNKSKVLGLINNVIGEKVLVLFDVDKDPHLSNSSRYFYHTLDRILYVGDIKISSKLVGNEIVPGSDLAHYVKSKDKLVSHLKSKFEKSLEKHKTTELEYISEVPNNAIEKSFKTWNRFREGLNLSSQENKVFLDDYEHLKQLSNEYIDIDSRIVFGHYLKLIRNSESLKGKFANSYFPNLNYRVDSSFIDFATVYLVNKDKNLLPNYKISGIVYSDTKSSVIRTFEQEIQLAELTGYSSVGEYTRTTTFRNKLKDISKRMTSFTTDFARLTIKNFCAENYK